VIWTAETTIYLPLVFPESVLAAAHRLAREVSWAMGAKPPLRHQPAPFGQAAILIAPDPAYTAAVAPNSPETFVAQTSGSELVVTGAEPFGTVLGLAWLGRQLGYLPFGKGWAPEADQPRTDRAQGDCEGRPYHQAGGAGLDLGELNYEQPPWAQASRAWLLSAEELAACDSDRLWSVGENLIRCGGNTLACVGEVPEAVADMTATLGLRCHSATGPPIAVAELPTAAPRWW